MTALLIALTVAEVVLLVTVLAVYLVRITASLRRTADKLAKTGFGVRAIETQCEPVGPAVLRLNDQLASIAGALEGLSRQAGDGRG